STSVAASEVFLSNDTALSEVTSVVQFDTTVPGKIGTIRVLLPAGSNAGAARLGRLTIADVALQVERGDATLTVDSSSANAVLVATATPGPVQPGSGTRVTLSPPKNRPAATPAVEAGPSAGGAPPPGVAPPASVTVYDAGSGDITAITAGTGLTGG